MKSKKRARTLPQPEECGIWLDASQLKKKSHQAVIPCTSSRYTPLSRKQSIDSVLVEFTQTTSPQLCTKQTSMYSFFSPAGNKKKQSCITEINTLAQETPPECEKNPPEVLNVIKPSTTGTSVCLKQTYRDCEPAENQACDYLYRIHRNPETPGSSGGNESDDKSSVLGKPGNLVGRFSSAPPCKSQENPPTVHWTAGFGCKYQNNWSDSSVSKCPQEDYRKEDLFPPSQFESQLFTQDTQGNRVICHRLTSERSMNGALQDKTNIPRDTRSPMKGTLQTVCDDDFLHKLFTQDSEGNTVIKH